MGRIYRKRNVSYGQKAVAAGLGYVMGVFILIVLAPFFTYPWFAAGISGFRLVGDDGNA